MRLLRTFRSKFSERNNPLRSSWTTYHVLTFHSSNEFLKRADAVKFMWQLRSTGVREEIE